MFAFNCIIYIYSLSILSSILSLVNAIGPILRPPPFEVDYKERASPIIKTFEQRIDHFVKGWAIGAVGKFQQRYAENLEFFNATGPMFLFIGGESSLYNEINYLSGGLVYELAKQNGAAIYALEHRYYGESIPGGSSNRRSYLSVDQDLGDIANFISNKIYENPGLKKVIVFGGSYPGALAAWARQKYPNYIDAAVSVSGMLDVKIDNYGYFEVLQKSIEAYPGCIDVLKDGFKTIYKKLRSIKGIMQVMNEFQLGIPILKTLISPYYRRVLMSYLVEEKITATVQYDQTVFNISDMCRNFTQNNGISNSQKLANYFNKFNAFKALRNSTNDPSALNDDKSWNYQVCSELGNFVTSTSQNEPFYNVFPLRFHYNDCLRNYGLRTALQLKAKNGKLVKKYGIGSLNATRIIFTTGTVDPWSAVGLKQDLNSESPLITIEGSSHGAVLSPSNVLDSPALTSARSRISTLLKQWINS